MSQEIDALVSKCVELREAGRLEEAILSARRATSVDPESANAWWQLALAVAEKDGDAAALDKFKKTVELADNFGFGWYRLGNAYKEISMLDEAVNAWETACLYDEDYQWTRYNLIDAYQARKLENEKEKLFDQLLELNVQGKLRTNDFHQLAIAYHSKADYLNSIPYYKKYLTYRSDVHGYTNLGLAYSSSQVGQKLDAADCYHLALTLDPDFERASNFLAGLVPKLENTKTNVQKYIVNHAVTSGGDCYENYISPFELLQIEGDEEADALEIKNIQKARKLVLQEIELEDGVVEWMPNLKIDRSRAIKLADELTDETLRLHHQQVFSCKPLLNFLSRGDLTLFSYDEEQVPINLLLTLEGDEDFAKWLSEIFCKQYDSLFAAVLSSKNIDVIEAILDGRRYVIPGDDDKCFTTAVRHSANFLVELRAERDKIEKTKPAIHAISSALTKNNIGRILEVLPPAFQKVQSEAAEMIRGISVDTYNHHGDAELAKEILKLAENFAKKSPSFKIKIEKDLATLNEFIAEEKKDESRITFGTTPFRVTKEGVTYGEQFIKAEEAETLRWGTLVENTAGSKTYDFKIVVGGKGGKQINVNWNSGVEIKKQDELFDKCITAIFAYIFPKVLDKFQSVLATGKTIHVGGIPISKFAITLKAEGWFSIKDEPCAWRFLKSEIKNGSAVISSTSNAKASASLSLADVDNAWILHILINRGMMK